MKECNTCHKRLPFSNFHQHPNGTYGLSGKCKDCRSQYNKEYNNKNRDRAKEWRKKYKWNPNTYLLKQYGFSFEEKIQRLQEQKNQCLICELELSIKDAKVDHSHETNAVRGILCHRCNTAIGLLRDNPILCEKARAYLTKYV